MARPVAFEKYPNVSTYTDRNGEIRYRFRFKGVNATLRGEYDSIEFQAHYNELLTQAGSSAKQELKLPEDCFRHIWSAFKVSRDFTEALSDYSIKKIIPVYEKFLMHPVAGKTFDIVPVREITFEQIEAYLWSVASTKQRVSGKVVGGPHAANFARIQLEKLFEYAVRKTLIKPAENPMPYVRKVLTPKTNANRAWTADERAQFEAFYPLGSLARTVYAVALYLGNRRSDIATITWDDMIEIPRRSTVDGSIHYVEAFRFRQVKNSLKVDGEGGKLVTLPVIPQLAAALAHLDRIPGAPVIMNMRGKQKGMAFAISSLTNSMKVWRRRAGLSDECKLHGLRSTYVTLLKEAGASKDSRKTMMGHTDDKTTAHYERGASTNGLSLEVAEKLSNYRPEEHEVRPAAHLRLVAKR